MGSDRLIEVCAIYRFLVNAQTEQPDSIAVAASRAERGILSTISGHTQKRMPSSIKASARKRIARFLQLSKQVGDKAQVL
jgi:hypothetical protein